MSPRRVPPLLNVTAVLSLLCATVAAGVAHQRFRAAASQRPQTAHVYKFALRPSCVVPFPNQSPLLDPFPFCDNAGRMAGMPAPTLAQRLRSDAKNNLCAPAQNPTLLTFDDMAALPDASAAELSRTREPLSAVGQAAGVLVGEGSVVRIVGFVRRAHVADCVPVNEPRGGNEANCHQVGFDMSDLRLELAPLPGRHDSDDCDRVIANIIPHLRPAAWRDLDLKTPQDPVRITGQLLYDDESTACRVDGRGRWEIHPVYSIDVCANRDLAHCDGSRETPWRPYDRWVVTPGARVFSSGRSERAACESAAIAVNAGE